jgi:hypothetical protein
MQIIKWVDGSVMDLDQHATLILLLNGWLFDLLDLQNIRGTIGFVNGGFHNFNLLHSYYVTCLLNLPSL